MWMLGGDRRCVTDGVAHVPGHTTQFRPLGFVPPLPGASTLMVCVSGYTSEARDSVGQLCHLLGIKCVLPQPPLSKL